MKPAEASGPPGPPLHPPWKPWNIQLSQGTGQGVSMTFNAASRLRSLEDRSAALGSSRSELPGMHSVPKSAVLPYASGVGGLSQRLLNREPSFPMTSETFKPSLRTMLACLGAVQALLGPCGAAFRAHHPGLPELLGIEPSFRSWHVLRLRALYCQAIALWVSPYTLHGSVALHLCETGPGIMKLGIHRPGP